MLSTNPDDAKPGFPVNFQLIEQTSITTDKINNDLPKVVSCVPKMTFLTRSKDNDNVYQIVRYCPLSQLEDNVQVKYKNSIQIYERSATGDAKLTAIGSIETLKFKDNIEESHLA